MFQFCLMIQSNDNGAFYGHVYKVAILYILVVFLLPSLLFIPQSVLWIWCTTFTLSNLVLLYPLYLRLRPADGRASHKLSSCAPMLWIFGLKLVAIACSWVVAVTTRQLDVCLQVQHYKDVICLPRTGCVYYSLGSL